MMQRRFLGLGLLAAAAVLVVGGWAAKGVAKGKDKSLPPYILTANTVNVMIDPSAGMDPEDPRANEIARRDVERALANWGRYTPQVGYVGADLIIVIRKGHGRLADATITNPGQNDRPGMITPTDNGASVGGQQGRVNPNIGGNNPYGANPPTGGNPQAAPHPQMELGGDADSFIVLDGKTQKPLDGVPGWRYTQQDALKSPSVPAVAEFRKAVAEAEKAAAAKKP
jgi:serine/threonine-protein kinase RIO1